MAQTRSRPAPTSQTVSPVDGLAQLSFLVQGALGRRAEEHGLSMIQIRLLGVLRDRRPTINELSALLELDKSSVSGLVDRAQRRGLVARTASTTDRRAVHVGLTARGRSVVRAAATGFEADIAQLLSQLPATDRRTLSRLVSRLLVANAEAHGVDLFATSDSVDVEPERIP